MVVNGGVREAEMVGFLPFTVVLIYQASVMPSEGLNASAQSGFLGCRAYSMSGRWMGGQAVSM